MELACRRLSDEATLPTRAHEGDAGLDLYAAEGATLGPGERAERRHRASRSRSRRGTPASSCPRSGLAARHGIALVNAPGLIDAGYRGEVRVLLLNTDRAEPFEIAPGDRIAQLLVTPFAAARPSRPSS